MGFPALIAYSLLAATSNNEAPETLVVLGIADAELEAKTVALVNELAVTEIQNILPAMRVLAPDDLEAVLGVEIAKDAFGCDDTRCAAEIGAALGARYLITGKSGRLGRDWLLSLKLIDQESLTVLSRSTVQTPSDDPPYQQVVRDAVGQLELTKKLPRKDRAVDLQPDAKSVGKKASMSKTDAALLPPPQAVQSPTPHLRSPSVPPREPRYLLLVGSAALLIASFLVDTLPSSSSNGEFDALDFVPVGGYTLGAAGLVIGLGSL